MDKPVMDKPSVLLTEDMPDILKLLEILVKRAGGTPASATTLAESRALIKSTPIELAFIDYTLPDGCGLDLCADIKARNPAARVVLLTAHSEHSIVDKTAFAKLDAYLHKPFTLDAIEKEFAFMRPRSSAPAGGGR